MYQKNTRNLAGLPKSGITWEQKLLSSFLCFYKHMIASFLVEQWLCSDCSINIAGTNYIDFLFFVFLSPCNLRARKKNLS